MLLLCLEHILFQKGPVYLLMIFSMNHSQHYLLTASIALSIRSLLKEMQNQMSSSKAAKK